MKIQYQNIIVISNANNPIKMRSMSPLIFGTATINLMKKQVPSKKKEKLKEK